MTHEPLLELRHVRRTFEAGETTVVALDDVSLTIGAAEMVAIQGPSGSGKSTLLQIIGLLDRPTSGAVLLDGQDLSALSDAEQTRLRLTTLGFVFQRFHLFNDLTATENVELPMEAAGVPLNERRARAAELLRAVGLGERMEFRPSRLSGGQRQRVAIARALANNPRIILADEPTGELHSEDKARVLALFQQFHAEGRAIVMVTHDKEVAATAERQIEIRDGQVAEITNATTLADAAQPLAMAAAGGGSEPTRLERRRAVILLPDGTPAEHHEVAPAEARGAQAYANGLSPLPPGDAPTAMTPASAAPAPTVPTAGTPMAAVPVATARRRSSRRWPRLLVTAALAIGLVAAGGVAYTRYGGSAGSTPAPTEQATTTKNVARGELRPESEATVRTLVGGVVTGLSVSIGSTVVENQELARVRTPDGAITVITAPWQGSVTNLPVHTGDTVTAGATIAAVGDISRLRIETDDVDEFMVARIRTGQSVTVTVDAIEGRELRGRVRSVALRSERDADGDLHYPVIVDLDWTPPDLRAGMTVRVHIPQE
ncbi:MAG: ATP-binding cassette domain-containing protein [Chloroflexi bacterium]|nr:ATP-binding cassette domain-containing protein [Chloroflexota bacterium]